MASPPVRVARPCRSIASTHPTAVTISATLSKRPCASSHGAIADGRREFKQMNDHIATLQEQVNTLFTNLSALRQHVDNHAPIDPSPYSQPYAPSIAASQMSMPGQSPSHNRSKSTPKYPPFQGPTSVAYNMNVARSSLETMGIGLSGAGESAEDPNIMPDPSLPASPPPQFPTSKVALHATKDPIWAVSKDEAVRLCRLYEDEIHSMYPIVDMEKLIRHANLLWMFLDAASRTGLMQGGLAGADAIEDDQTVLLKLVMAITLVMEGSGSSELGTRIFDHVAAAVERQLLAPVELKSIQMLALAVSGLGCSPLAK